VPAEEVLAWRAALQDAAVVQPFKQAHREIYRLTDAERETETYSNRFAGHIPRQHQMVALAKARGWTAGLQGGFDGGGTPSKSYPAFGLSVEFACEGPEDETELSEHGIYVRVWSDAIRFRRLVPAEAARPPRPDKAAVASLPGRLVLAGTDPGGIPVRELWASMRQQSRFPAHMKLDEVPARCLSEAMRDIDLFVGVASIGADPAWRDGGPNGPFGDYWRRFAAAELTASGESRRAALEALPPRLELGRVARIDGRNLLVSGKRFTYRIHIGCGSIFVEPPGQYLCIMADRRGTDPKPWLPFEGDAMLSLMLSKAMLLAEDDRIKDQSILSQLAALPAAI
jgi:hypothetical protein